MSQQEQGDVVGRLERPHAVSILSMSKEALEASLNRAWDEIERLRELCDGGWPARTLLSSSRGEQGWRSMDDAPTDGTHIIGNTQWGALEIWWHKDAYEGEYWTDEGDSEPEPTGWVPVPGSVPTSSLAGQVPDGFVLVPKEPTDGMIEAGHEAMEAAISVFASDIYAAMLSVAPRRPE